MATKGVPGRRGGDPVSNRPDCTYARHILLSETKKIYKELFGKGPENVRLRIAGDVVVIELSRFLRTAEVRMIEQQPQKARLIKAYRQAILESMKEEVLQRVEAVLGCKVIRYLYEIDVPKNSAITVFILDKPF